MGFQIKSFDNNVTYEKSFIYKLGICYEEIFRKQDLDFILIKARKDTNSLINIAALFISEIDFAVLNDDFDDDEIKEMFHKKKILVLDDFNEMKIKNYKYNYDSLNSKIEISINNNKRKILYLSSGSTGNPKLIEITSQSAFICHKKVLNLNVLNKNIENIFCFHSNSFVISLNYILLGILADVQLVTLYNGGPLKMASCLRIIGHKTLIISVPSYWEKLAPFLKSQAIKINTVFSCGEPLKFEVAKIIRNIVLKKFFNFYGATEFATWIFYFEISRNYIKEFSNKNEIFVPIGKPLQEVKIHIEKNGLMGVSCNHMAENYIKNNYSYLNVDFKNIRGDKYIFIGDRVKKKNNTIYCEGRIDGLVKVKGIFVDLFKLQEILILILFNRQFLLEVGKDQSIYLFIGSEKLDKYDKEKLEKKVSQNLSKVISRKINLKIIFEDKGLKLNRSSKVDKFFYKKLIN